MAKKKKKRQPHGGARTNAGRPSQFGEPKKPVSMRLSPTVVEFLADQEDSVACHVESLIRRSAAFRRWNG